MTENSQTAIESPLMLEGEVMRVLRVPTRRRFGRALRDSKVPQPDHVIAGQRMWVRERFMSWLMGESAKGASREV
jgi:hypothetical protein